MIGYADIYPPTESAAVISEDGEHRLVLSRRFGIQRSVFDRGGAADAEWSVLPPLLVIMLNPSIATAKKNDPTVRKLIAYAQRWGHGGIIIGNLWTYRTPSPDELRAAARTNPERVNHRDADQALAYMFAITRASRGRALAGWGGKADEMDDGPERVEVVRRMAAGCGLDLEALSETKSGQPCHPLYLAYELQPKPWPMVRS